jgi:hypothetical protein
VLGGVKALRYGTFVSPGESLRVEVELKKFEDGLATFRGEGLVLAPGIDPEAADTAVSGRFTMRPIRIAVPEAAAIAGDGSPAR